MFRWILLYANFIFSFNTSDPGDFEDVNIDQVNSEDEFENVNMCDSSGNLRDSDSKGAKRTGSKGVAKNKSKGKAWKKA